jgi:hypothetical protein
MQLDKLEKEVKIALDISPEGGATDPTKAIDWRR